MSGQKNFALDHANASVGVEHRRRRRSFSGTCCVNRAAQGRSQRRCTTDAPNGYRGLPASFSIGAAGFVTAIGTPDRLVRLFCRTEARFSGGRVHEKLELRGEHSILPGHLHHFTYDRRPPIAPTVAPNMLHYMAQSARGECIARAYPWSGPVHALARFGKGFFLKRGFLDGSIGWDIASGNAREVWLKYKLLRKLNAQSN